MADGDVKYRFMADASSAERVIAQLEKRLDSLENKLKQTSRTSKKSNDDFLSGFKDVEGAAMSLVGTYASIDGAISLVAAGYRAWTADVDRLASSLGKANQELRAQLVAANDFANGAQIKNFLQNVPGATQGQAQGIFGSVTGAAPELDLQRRLAITGNAARVLPIAGEERAQQVAGLAADLGAMLPGKNAGDLTDFAMSIQGALGERAGEANAPAFEKAFGQLLNAGMSGEQSAALLVNAMQSGLGPRNISDMAAKMASEGVGVDAMFANPALAQKVLGAKGNSAFGLLNQQAIAGLESQFAAAQTGNITDAALQQAIAIDPAGVGRTLATAQEEKAMRGFSERFDALNAAQSQRLASSSNGGMRAINKGLGFLESTSAYFGGDTLSELGRFAASVANPGVGPLFGAAGRSAEGAIASQGPGVDQAAADVVQQLKRLNENLERQNANRPPIQRNAQTE